MPAPIKKLTLVRETVRTLKVQSKIRTGESVPLDPTLGTRKCIASVSGVGHNTGGSFTAGGQPTGNGESTSSVSSPQLPAPDGTV